MYLVYLLLVLDFVVAVANFFCGCCCVGCRLFWPIAMFRVLTSCVFPHTMVCKPQDIKINSNSQTNSMNNKPKNAQYCNRLMIFVGYLVDVVVPLVVWMRSPLAAPVHGTWTSGAACWPGPGATGPMCSPRTAETWHTARCLRMSRVFCRRSGVSLYGWLRNIVRVERPRCFRDSLCSLCAVDCHGLIKIVRRWNLLCICGGRSCQNWRARARSRTQKVLGERQRTYGSCSTDTTKSLEMWHQSQTK